MGSSISTGMPALLHAAGGYFETPDGQPVYLAGSHTWTNGQNLTSVPFDFSAYLDFLGSENANFIRSWTWESPTNGATTLPFAQGSDGKFDLTQFNQSYFDNIRAHAQAAGNRGIYYSIMLFEGWSVSANGKPDNPWTTNPFNAANNVNGINGDPGHTGNGVSTETLADPAIFALQKAYVAHVIDTVGDLSNVLFEIANETLGTPEAIAWQNALTDFIHQYEAAKGGLLHPVGITAPYPASESFVNTALAASHADWISPSGIDGGFHNNPPDATGAKVVLVDSDHVFGIGGDANWVWQQFTRGYNVLSMDDLSGTGIGGTLQLNLSADLIAQEQSARIGIASTRQVASLVDFAGLAPSDGLSSTSYALADPADGTFIIYAPSGGTFTANLSGAGSRTLDVRWVNTASGQISTATSVAGGSGNQSFTAPYSSAALVLTPHVGASAPAATVIVPTVAPPAPVTVPPVDPGSTPATPDVLVVGLSEDAWQGDAQALITIDGRTLTSQPLNVTASHTQGESATYTFTGTFGSGVHQVGVSFLNDAWGGNSSADRNLYVDQVKLNGNASPDLVGFAGTLPWTMTKQFDVSGGSASSSAPAPDQVALHISEDAWQGDAQFTIAIDGKTVAGPQMAFASHARGESQSFIVQGAFGAGPHDVSVTFLNDAWGGTSAMDRNLYVDDIEFNGRSALAQPVGLYNNGSTSATIDASAAGFATRTFNSPQPDIVLAVS